MAVSLTQRSQWSGAPVVRSRIWGKPSTSNVSTVNRSEMIRRIFMARGNISNNRLHSLLANEGLNVSSSLIYSVRNWMVAQGHF